MNKQKVVYGDFREKFTIPEVWKISKIEDLVKKIKAGGTPDTKISKYYDGKIPFISISDMTKGKKYLNSEIKTITNEGLENSAAWIVPKNSLLLSMYATIGKPLINKKEISTHQGILGIIPTEKIIELEFLYYALLYIRPKLVRYFLIGTQANLNLHISKNLKIIHPENIKEQEKIALILSNADYLISSYDEILTHTKCLKHGLMQTLLTKGIGHKKFKNVDLGFGKIIEFAEEWEIGKLNENTSKIGSGITPLGGSEIYQKEGIPLIRSQNVHFDGLHLDNVAHITQEIHDKMNGSKLQSDDVLLNITAASIGRCSIVPKGFGEGNVNQHVCIIRSKPSLFPGFLNYFLTSSLMQNVINSVQGGLSRQGLNFKDLGNLYIPIPKFEEQQKIAAIISKIDNKIVDLKLKKTNLEILKKGLMQKLLTGERRVNV